MEADDMSNFDVEVHVPLIVSQGFGEEIACASYTDVTVNDSFEMDDMGNAIKASIFKEGII